MKRTHLFKALMGLVFLAFLAPLAASEKHPSSATWSSSPASSSSAAVSSSSESDRKEGEQKRNVDGYERDAKEQAAQGSSEQDDVRPGSLLYACLHKLVECITIKASGVTGSSLTTAIKELSPSITTLPEKIGNKIIPILEQSWQQVWTQELPEHVSHVYFKDGELHGHQDNTQPNAAAAAVAVAVAGEESDGEEEDEEETETGDADTGVDAEEHEDSEDEPKEWSMCAWNIETGAHKTYTQIYTPKPGHCVKDAVRYDNSSNKLYHANLEKNYTITLRDYNDLDRVLVSIPAPSHRYHTTPDNKYNNVRIGFIDDTHIEVTNDDRTHITIYGIDYEKRTFTVVHTLQAQDIRSVTYKLIRNNLGHVWLRNGNAYFFNYTTYTTELFEKDVLEIIHCCDLQIKLRKIGGEIMAFGIQDSRIVSRIPVQSAAAGGIEASVHGRYLASGKPNTSALAADYFQYYTIDLFDLIAGKKLGTINYKSEDFVGKISVAVSDNGPCLAVLCTSRDRKKQNLSMWKLLPTKTYPADLPYQHKLVTYLCKQALKNSKTQDELLALLSSPSLLQLSQEQRKPITDEIFATLSELDNEHDAEIEHAHEKEHKKRKAEESVEGDKQSPKKSRKNDSLSDK